ncbi:MAG: hypothetical protein D6681_10650 [Calditrichaeota bacterium]|nr:MAG: hypothetical protein D6681_10650 [Calditrichota bacterium]
MVFKKKLGLTILFFNEMVSPVVYRHGYKPEPVIRASVDQGSDFRLGVLALTLPLPPRQPKTPEFFHLQRFVLIRENCL